MGICRGGIPDPPPPVDRELWNQWLFLQKFLVLAVERPRRFSGTRWIKRCLRGERDGSVKLDSLPRLVEEVMATAV